MTKQDGKKNVLLAFEDGLMIDTKKVLFKHNLTFQQYITFVIHRLVLEDPSARDLLKRAVEFNENALDAAQKDEIKKVNTQNLYSLFERLDQEKNK